MKLNRFNLEELQAFRFTQAARIGVPHPLKNKLREQFKRHAEALAQ